MTATVKAVRSENGHQLDVRARVLLCRRAHHTTAPVNVKLIVDTGSSNTILRTRALAGVEFKRNHMIGGIGGHQVPAMRTRAHLILDDQLLTTEVLVIEVDDGTEDGVIGLDLLHSMALRDGQAELRLAASGGRYRSAMDERLTAEDCGCWRFLQQSVKDHGGWARTGV